MNCALVEKTDRIVVPAIAEDNPQWIKLWLHGKSPNTQDSYRRDIEQFLTFIEDKALQTVTLNDLQGFAQFLIEQGYKPATQQRRLNCVKSLFSFGCELGVIRVNLGQFIKPLKLKNTLAERILSEAQVLNMIEQTTDLRDRLLIRLLYATGARVSEICNLHWLDVREGMQGRGQVTLFGKGGQTRVVLFSAATWQILQQLRGEAQETHGMRNALGKEGLGRRRRGGCGDEIIR